jgi:hypothetical protein
MDPVISKIGATPAGLDNAADSTTEKRGPSKFDKALERANGVLKEKCTVPSGVDQIPQEAQHELRAQLRRKLEHNPSATAAELFRDDLQTHKVRLSGVSKRVAALPKVGAFEALRNHLSGLESQYQATGRSVSVMTATPNMGDLLRLQQDVYRMSQNLEIFSRTVDQAVSGIKTIIQTQV